MSERLCVMRGRRPEPADLPDVLQRGGPDVVVGHVLGIRLAQGLDAATHDTTVRNKAPRPPPRRGHGSYGHGLSSGSSPPVTDSVSAAEAGRPTSHAAIAQEGPATTTLRAAPPLT